MNLNDIIKIHIQQQILKAMNKLGLERTLESIEKNYSFNKKLQREMLNIFWSIIN